MKKNKISLRCVASRQTLMFRGFFLGLFSLVFSCALLYGQSNSPVQQGYDNDQSSSGQDYIQGQGYTQIRGQTAVQSPGVDPSDSSSISVQRIMQIISDNPEFAEEAKSIGMERMREEGRTPPGGELSSSFVESEIQTDTVLKARLVQAIQQRGLLPESSSSTQSGKSGGAYSGMQSGTGGTSEKGVRSSASNGQSKQSTLSQIPPSTNRELSRQQLVRQPDPYGDLQSLRDLYTQIKEDTSGLKRFGEDVFLTGTGNIEMLPVDLPAGPDYILGSGDALNIHLWGGIERSLSETVDRSGRIALPGIASVMVASRSLAQAQEAIRVALSGQFKNLKVDVSLARIRSIRVYVVGDVQRPGGYDISSLSTPLNALFAAGGPTAQGSFRKVKHYRGDKLVADVDLYDLLLNGISKDVSRLQSGDTILVPPVGPQVTVAGMVRRPAIYEVSDGADLAKVVDLAGGLQVSATLGRISVERIEAHKRHVTLNLQVPDAAEKGTIANLLGSFHVQDGDRVIISSILPYREETVYLQGHVFRPGKRAFNKGIQVADLIHSYQEILPEPAEHAEIIRLVPPEYRPVVIDFRLSEMLAGAPPIYLQPFDTVRVFGRYEFDAPKVTINGEVMLPGEYPMAQNMTASELVRLAGGFKRSAFTGEADIASYVIQNNSQILVDHKILQISEAMNGNAAADITLKAGDILTIRQLTGWEDIGASVTLSGEVVHPGTYGIVIGEKLSKLIERAGGFRPTAFPQGAVLERVHVRELEEKSQKELIDRIQSQGVGGAVSQLPGANAQDTAAQLQAMEEQQKQAVAALRSHPPSGRLVINISANINEWKDKSGDLEIRTGDVITIPKRSDLVMINGQIYNPSAMSFVPGKSAEWYLRAAGGFTELANKHAVFIVRANGSVISNGGGHNGHNVLTTRVKTGDMIIVPQKVVGGSPTWRNLINAAQVISGMAITARVATSF